MISVAVIGPDGAGKTTVTQQLATLLPVPVRYIYMGVNPDASNVMLPTTRLLLLVKRLRGGSRAAAQPMAAPAEPALSSPGRKGLAGRVKTNLRITNRIAEEWYRQALAWSYRRRGNVVLFDRHFIADAAVEPGQPAAPQVAAQRLRKLLLERVYPQPDLVVYLDAPAEVLFARKGEGTLESLEARRRAYLQLGERTRDFVVVDAQQSAPEVARAVADAIIARLDARGAGTRRASVPARPES